MLQEIQAKAGDRIEVLEVFVRDIQAPARVRTATGEKLQREQQVEQEQFQTQIIQERRSSRWKRPGILRKRRSSSRRG